MPDRIVALVPLRGGSVSIPDKNIKPLLGRPLCDWALAAATAARRVDAVFVSTDSEAIARVVQESRPEVGIVWRPAELATDTATTESVMLHFSDQVPFDILVTLQATSPLTTADDIDSAVSLLVSEGYDSVLSGVATNRFYWDGGGRPLNYDPAARPRRQDHAPCYVENGAIYVTRRTVLQTQRCRLGNHVGLSPMPADTLIEIDEPADWPAAEALLANRLRKSCLDRARSVRLLVCDVDGTLTDGGMYYDADGERLKRFSTRDAMGLERLRSHGVEVVIATKEQSAISESRARKLKIPCYSGVHDKRDFLNRVCSEKAVNLRDIAFIGDDVNDVEALVAVGLSACPADAVSAVKDIALFVTSAPAGRGAVRELCEFIIGAKA